MSTTEYIDWRKSVFERDDYTCCECGKQGGTLNAHHIKPVFLFRIWYLKLKMDKLYV